MPDSEPGAQRASLTGFQRLRRVSVLAFAAIFLASAGLAASPPPAAAASIKVVVVVGPVGSQTASYIRNARTYAKLARGYGAKVIEIYSPNATWSKVKSALKGANLLIYLGHGNGWPSPYAPFAKTSKDGLGLNARAGRGHNNNKYYGEQLIDRYVQMDKNAVVILNRLCYASGNSEWGRANPTKATARKRIDNYGAGFLRAGAKAVFAEAVESVSYTIRALFTSNRTMDNILMSHPAASGARDFTFNSTRTPGYKAHSDPPKAGKYWRSLIGNLSLKASTWRASAT